MKNILKTTMVALLLVSCSAPQEQESLYIPKLFKVESLGIETDTEYVYHIKVSGTLVVNYISIGTVKADVYREGNCVDKQNKRICDVLIEPNCLENKLVVSTKQNGFYSLEVKGIHSGYYDLDNFRPSITILNPSKNYFIVRVEKHEKISQVFVKKEYLYYEK